ncbi:sarcosine oxidase subunit delta [Coralliovum pocilloporae]|uniref:sarcosine oxidase subunit delta n=1 Tax=Coralliovum pocilloporae TaxID=3066369 RepID=UPI00330750F5
MLIDCPCCGKRDRREFTYLGDATIKRPEMDNDTSEDWYAFVFQRDNPRGWHDEIWHHSQGCRSFIEARRNTATHEFAGTRLIGPWAGKEGAE